MFHQKFHLLSSGLKNALTKHFQKMQPFANVLQSICYYKFPDIYKKISVLESLFNKVTGLMVCSSIKKETSTQMVSCEYHKKFEESFFMERLWWLHLKMIEKFLRISKGSLTRNELYDSTNRTYKFQNHGNFLY